MANIKQVNDTNFWTEVKAAPLALVDFWAPWCGPCRILGPILEEVNKNTGESVSIMKMNVDENMMTPNSFGIRGIPTMILFKEGKQVETIVGLRDKNEIEMLIKKYAK